MEFITCVGAKTVAQPPSTFGFHLEIFCFLERNIFQVDLNLRLRQRRRQANRINILFRNTQRTTSFSYSPWKSKSVWNWFDFSIYVYRFVYMITKFNHGNRCWRDDHRWRKIWKNSECDKSREVKTRRFWKHSCNGISIGSIVWLMQVIDCILRHRSLDRHSNGKF